MPIVPAGLYFWMTEEQSLAAEGLRVVALKGRAVDKTNAALILRPLESVPYVLWAAVAMLSPAMGAVEDRAEGPQARPLLPLQQGAAVQLW